MPFHSIRYIALIVAFVLTSLSLSIGIGHSQSLVKPHSPKKYKPCYCGNVQGREHPRYYISHRAYQATLVPSRAVAIDEIFRWKAPQGEIPEGKAIGREDSLFQVEGVLREARIDLADCDMEFTIAADHGAIRTVLARLPNNKDYCDLRDKVLRELKDSCGVDTLWEMKTIDFGARVNAPRIRILAWAFYDRSPEPDVVPIGAPAGTRPRRTRPPMWELRPVQDITIRKPGR